MRLGNWPAAKPLAPTPAGSAFVQGFVAAGLLAAVQDRAGRPAADRRTLRLALQGGASLAAGTYAAQAWRRGETGRALAAVAVGAAGVAAIEGMLRQPVSKESRNEQEES